MKEQLAQLKQTVSEIRAVSNINPGKKIALSEIALEQSLSLLESITEEIETLKQVKVEYVEEVNHA